VVEKSDGRDRSGTGEEQGTGQRLSSSEWWNGLTEAEQADLLKKNNLLKDNNAGAAWVSLTRSAQKKLAKQWDAENKSLVDEVLAKKQDENADEADRSEIEEIDGKPGETTEHDTNDLNFRVGTTDAEKQQATELLDSLSRATEEDGQSGADNVPQDTPGKQRMRGGAESPYWLTPSTLHSETRAYLISSGNRLTPLVILPQ
jgi:hypothetical protein